jgi:hypothetical protein
MFRDKKREKEGLPLPFYAFLLSRKTKETNVRTNIFDLNQRKKTV